MSEVVLTAESGRPIGSPSSRRIRTLDKIPGVLYGQGMEPVAVTVGRRELRAALSGPAGSNTLLSLAVDGASYPAIVKEMQRHPVRRTVNHVDFLRVNLDEDITVMVPLRLVGEAKAVAAEGALVDPSVDTIEVLCRPRDVPNELVVDITEMHVGDVIRLADVALPQGVTATGDPDMAVVTTLTTSAAEAEEAAEEEAAEAAEGAEGEAGAEAAEGDSSSE
jgi:large subunit ribosomal protein L25